MKNQKMVTVVWLKNKQEGNDPAILTKESKGKFAFEDKIKSKNKLLKQLCLFLR
jgi:hypothetical protein